MLSDPELVGYGECLIPTSAEVDAERLRIPLPEELDSDRDAEDSVMPVVAPWCRSNRSYACSLAPRGAAQV